MHKFPTPTTAISFILNLIDLIVFLYISRFILCVGIIIISNVHLCYLHYVVSFCSYLRNVMVVLFIYFQLFFVYVYIYTDVFFFHMYCIIFIVLCSLYMYMHLGIEMCFVSHSFVYIYSCYLD